MEDIGHNEDTPVGVASTPTPEKSQLVQDCPAPVYMAKVSNGAAEIHKSYAQAVCTVQHFPERTRHGLGMNGVPDAPRKQSKAVRKPKAESTPMFKRVKPWNMHGCVRNEDFAVLLHVKYFVTETNNLTTILEDSTRHPELPGEPQ